MKSINCWGKSLEEYKLQWFSGVATEKCQGDCFKNVISQVWNARPIGLDFSGARGSGLLTMLPRWVSGTARPASAPGLAFGNH